MRNSSGQKASAVYSPKKEKIGEPEVIYWISEGDILSLFDVRIKEGQTSIPKHFTEDTLLQMMESADANEIPRVIF